MPGRHEVTGSSPVSRFSTAEDRSPEGPRSPKGPRTERSSGGLEGHGPLWSLTNTSFAAARAAGGGVFCCKRVLRACL